MPWAEGGKGGKGIRLKEGRGGVRSPKEIFTQNAIKKRLHAGCVMLVIAREGMK